MKFTWFKKNENNEAWEKARTLRINVFAIEQNVDISYELDELDEKAWHLIVEKDDQLVGVARMFPLENTTFRLGRLAIDQKFRGQGLNVPILTKIVNKIKSLNGKTILIHSQAYIQNMYTKFGFKTTTGEIFKEDEIDHIEMIYEIK